MTKLVSVVRSDDYPFDRRQLPLPVDDTLTMVIQLSDLSDTCAGCSQTNIKQKELERFVTRFRALTNDEVAIALMVTSREIVDMLAQLVPCVGCRKSVERLFQQLSSSCEPALEPLVITPNSILSIQREVLFDPKAMYALLYVHGSRLSEIMESIPKSRKNKRCQLHSLDSHKVKTVGWDDIWDILSEECREEVCLFKFDSFTETMDTYLRKHRFCTDCKAKVQRAYKILIKEVDPSSEKAYCADLYQGLRCCQKEGHIHILAKTDFVGKLIERAEPELTGRRERHAKTLDIAQEEVLTCLGIHVYERLHKVWQKLRAEEQTWQLLFYLGVDALRKNFEVALEKKQGISNLELMCEELLQEERAREERRKNKQQKRKRKKGKKQSAVEQEEGKEDCTCDENTNVKSLPCNSCDDDHHSNNTSLHSNNNILHNTGSPCKCDEDVCLGMKGSERSDCGYSSGHDVCDADSTPSSRDGSDVACSEGICNHEGDTVLCNQGQGPPSLAADLLPCTSCGDDCSLDFSPKHCSNGSAAAYWQNTTPSKSPVMHQQNFYTCDMRGCGDNPQSTCFSLIDAFDSIQDETCSGEEGESELISAEEIRQFRANATRHSTERQRLRETLKKRFADLTLKNNIHMAN